MAINKAMFKHRSYYLFICLFVGWIVVTILPAFLLFSDIIFANEVEPSLIYSVTANFFAVFLSLFASSYFSKYPAQQSIYVLSLLLFTIIMITGFIFFIFRLPYSIYYFTLSMLFLIIFSFSSHNILQSVSKQVVGYIPLGRCNELIAIDSVKWVNLQNDSIDYQKLNAVVADFSDEKVQKYWAKTLAKISIQGVPVYNSIQAKELLTGRIAISHLYENDLGSFRLSPIYKLSKRLMDIGLVLLSLPIVLPIMLITAIAIKLDSAGNVIFTQQRMGLGGKVFTMYKFRSMTANAENQNTVMTQIGDTRITKVGHIIRKLRIDELPQFWNILKGDMSLIGPRPELPNMVEKLEQEIPFYIYRQLVKPGLSGWAQVTQGGDHVENIAEKLEYDFYYIKNASISLDLLIIIKTIQTILTGFGAR